MIAAWLDGSLDEERKTLLGNLLMQPQYQELLDAIMQQQQQDGYSVEADYNASYLRMRESLESRVGAGVARVHKFPWVRVAAAAAAAVMVLVATVWMFPNKKETKSVVVQPEKKIEVIAQGQEGAVLTLADGSTMLLDSMGNGVLAQQTGTAVVLNNGQLEYKTNGSTSEKETFNTLSTPRGRLFRIILPDGTIAWLNAASSIKFPTRFTKDVRRVEISGEVYFEAAKMMRNGKKIPLIVNADNKFEVEVLGTHFNVNAYSNEPVLNTTLLEGSVVVSAKTLAGGASQKLLLKPGQQAGLKINNGNIEGKVRTADIGKVMAWKNGAFNFDDVKLDELMRQLERWYDIDVKYAAGVPNIEFVGKMTRDIDLNGLLVILEKSNVHFRLESRTLIILP